jgi:hypothetical protein
LAIYEKSQNPDDPSIPYAQACYWAASKNQEKALKYLKLSLEKGYKRSFFNEPDFSYLQGNTEFEALAAESRKRFNFK